MSSTPSPLIANARMYSVAPGAADAWHALFRHVSEVAEVRFEIIEHAFPLLVADLWHRPDLVCAFMCGWPWAREGMKMQPIAAPVPLDSARPVYWSDLVVRADCPAESLLDLDGARAGFTLLDSQSGFSAFRHHLISLGDAAPSFSAIVGPLTTPRRSIEAVAEGRADVAPIDSYAHALLRRHVPELTAQVRVLTRTEPTPIPMLVASPGIDPALVARLRNALLSIHDKALLHPLALLGFSEPLPPKDYQQMEYCAHAAEMAGITDLTEFLRVGTAS